MSKVVITFIGIARFYNVMFMLDWHILLIWPLNITLHKKEFIISIKCHFALVFHNFDLGKFGIWLRVDLKVEGLR